MVFPRREPNIAEHNPERTSPEFAAIHEQLRSNKYVRLWNPHARTPIDKLKKR